MMPWLDGSIGLRGCLYFETMVTVSSVSSVCFVLLGDFVTVCVAVRSCCVCCGDGRRNVPRRVMGSGVIDSGSVASVLAGRL